MAEKNYPPFHLSVTAEGLVSLWDTEKAARNASADTHEPRETYVCLQLNDKQLDELAEAAFRVHNYSWPYVK